MFRTAAYIIGAIAIVAVSFWTTLIVLDKYSPSRPAGSANAPASSIGDLPRIARSGAFPAAWSALVGLQATDDGTRAVAPGQPVLKLMATSTHGGHQIEMKVSSLEKDKVYFAIIWVKRGTQTKVFVQTHDGDQAPPSYGVFFADIGNQRIYNLHHVLSPTTMRPGPDGWLKLQVPLRTADGSVSIMLGFLGNDDSTVYQGDGQSALSFGGVEMLPQG